MRSVSAIRADIEALEIHLEEARSVEGYAGVDLMRSGMEEMRSDLVEALDRARRHEVDIVIEGDPVFDHEVRVDALARLLRSFQETVSSIAQALTGKATGRSSIPGPLREATAFRLAAVFPGSFGAVLRGPTDDRPELAMFDEDDVPTILDAAVDRVLEIIDLAGIDGTVDDPIVEMVLPLGSRVFKHLADLSSAIVDEGMTASFAWRSPATGERSATLSRSAARRLDDVLGRNKLTEREQVIDGRLGTVSDIRNRIELQTDGGEIVTAKVIEEVVPQLGAFYTRRVAATFEVTTIRSQVTGLEKNSYTLLGLATLPEQTTFDEAAEPDDDADGLDDEYPF